MQFIEELRELCARHDIHLSGTLHIIPLDGSWDRESRRLEVKPVVYHGGIRDTRGPFLVASIERAQATPAEIKAAKTIHINRDIDGYDCPVTGKWIGSRREHRENLKRTDCRIQEPGEKREYIKNMERNREAALDRQVSQAVRSIAHQFE